MQVDYKTVEVGDLFHVHGHWLAPQGALCRVTRLYNRKDNDYGLDCIVVPSGEKVTLGDGELRRGGVVLLAKEPSPADCDEEYTGGSVSYYTVRVENPTTPGVDPYDAECNDIIEALDMNYAEGNAFKAIWRRAAARKGLKKKGYTDGLYDAEKVVFFGQRMVVQEKADASED